MRIVDAFMHASERPVGDLVRLAREGVGVVVEPVRSPAGGWTHEASYRDHLRRLVEIEPVRAESAGMRHVQAVGVPAGSAELDVAMRCAEEAREWLNRETVVAVGPASLWSNDPDEEELLKRHVDLAAEADLPLVATVGGGDAAIRARRAAGIVEDMGLPLGRLLVAGRNGAALRAAQEEGAWIAVLAGPGRGAARVVRILDDLDPERTLVGSALERDAAEPHVLARITVALRESGREPGTVERLLGRNALEFFGPSGRLDKS